MDASSQTKPSYEEYTTLDELRTPSAQPTQMDFRSNIFTSTPFGQYTFQPNVQTTSSVASSSIPIATVNSKVNLTKYGGYSHEDSKKFIREFNSYCTFNTISDDARRIAAFHLHLEGPALVWYNTLSDFQKSSWTTLLRYFEREFSDVNATMAAESAIFDSLTLGPAQPLESFYSVILEKGNRLHKPDRDLISKFINGLPPQLAFFVRAGKGGTLRDALTSAKLGEAYGYRTAPSVSAMTTSTNVLQSDRSVHHQLEEISNRLAKLETRDPRRPTEIPCATNSRPPSFQPQQRQFNKRTICHKCSGDGHVQKLCNWNGKGSSRPDIKCQLCFQSGHGVKFCSRFQQPVMGNGPRGPDRGQ